MVAVFASFVLNGDPTVKQFGVGLAVAVAIDATVVRCLLVPAVMIIFGKANWWFPGWLERHLPQPGIEGESTSARSTSPTRRSRRLKPERRRAPGPSGRWTG